MTATDLPDDVDLDADQEDHGPDIGRRAPDKPRAAVKPFTLYSYDGSGAETPHRMRARPDELDYATFLAFTGKHVDGLERVNALHHGLRKVLCDDDGIPASATVRVVVDRDGAWVAVTDLDDDDTPDLDELRYTADGEQVHDDYDTAETDGFDRGSSLRRYDTLMDPASPGIISQDTPEGVVRYLLGGGGGKGARPTKSSRPSSGSRRTKKTRSGAG